MALALSTRLPMWAWARFVATCGDAQGMVQADHIVPDDVVGCDFCRAHGKARAMFRRAVSTVMFSDSAALREGVR